MLRGDKSMRHNIPDNPMLFRHAETEIELDERWKSELNRRHLG